MPYSYLGIDESNHGGDPQSPLIYVGVLSQDPKEIRVSSPQSKRTFRQRENFDLETRSFFYLLLEQKQKDLFVDDLNIKIMMIAELISAAPLDLEQVFMDGYLRQHTSKRILSFVQTSHPRIQGVIDGDRKIPLIRVADRIAHTLFCHYRFNPSRTPPELAHGILLHPNYEKYTDLSYLSSIRAS